MTPTTHLLASWLVADSFKLERRDRNLVTWCGLLPDRDGLGLVVDLTNALLGRTETAWYHAYHHSLLHGIAAAVVLPGLAALVAQRRTRVLALGFVVVHLHFLCDLLGSRGPALRTCGRFPTLPRSRHTGPGSGTASGAWTAGRTSSSRSRCWRSRSSAPCVAAIHPSRCSVFARTGRWLPCCANGSNVSRESLAYPLFHAAAAEPAALRNCMDTA